MNRKVLYSLVGIFVLAVLAIVLVIVIKRNNNNEDEIIVYTHSGAIRGMKIDSNISNFYAFFSVPYAKPPINNLRFKSPLPIESWEGIHDGTKEGPRCIQSTTENVSEDCLTLSVYSTDIKAVGKPVFVSLHGGAFMFGSAQIKEYGPDFFMRHDIIVVTLQFRLSIFGFLNLNLEDAPGNMGLADVIEALKWIKSNIEFFGGDPNSVTVGGVSSGGIMAHVLQISPKAQGLLHKTIISSGTGLSYRFYHNDTQNSVDKTKEAVGMSDSTNEDLLAHLMTLSSTELNQMASTIMNIYPRVYAHYYPYVMTRDYQGIIPEHPLQIVEKNSYQHLPMLIGMNYDEGIRLEQEMDTLDVVNENFNVVVPTDLFPIDDMSYEKNETARTIKEFYFGNNDLSKDTFPEYVKLCTDSWYGITTDYVVRMQGYLNYNSSIYYYVFAVDGAYNQQKVKNNVSSPGANHADDLGYIWKMNLFDDTVPDDDFSDLCRDRLVDMWSKFIKTGNPTPQVNTLTPVQWEPVEYPDVKYLLINQTITLGRDPFLERLRFWQRLYSWREL